MSIPKVPMKTQQDHPQAAGKPLMLVGLSLAVEKMFRIPQQARQIQGNRAFGAGIEAARYRLTLRRVFNSASLWACCSMPTFYFMSSTKGRTPFCPVRRNLHPHPR